MECTFSSHKCTWNFEMLGVGQGCRIYGTGAQNDTREDFLAMRHSILSQLLLFILPDQLLCILQNMCVCVGGGLVAQSV